MLKELARALSEKEVELNPSLTDPHLIHSAAPWASLTVGWQI